jgi:Ca2+-binding EF-hand superfamily protein
MVRRWLAALALMFGLFVLSADAQDGEKEKKGIGKNVPPEVAFKKMDADGDNKVTKAEFKKLFEQAAKGKLGGKGGALGDRIFDQLDADGDGKLTLDEYKKVEELREKFGKGGKMDPEKLKALKEKFGGKIDPEKLKELREKRKGEKE